MIIHNPKVSGSLFFPADSSGNQIILKVDNGTLQTIQVDSSGADTGVTPKSDFSGSFTGSFIGDGSNLTGIAASTFNIDLLDAGTIVGDDNMLFSDTSDSGTEKKGTFVSGLDSVGVISGSSQVQLGSATGTIDLSTQTNFAVGDTAQIDLILTNDTLTAHIKGGVISGSAQLLNVATDFGSGRVSGDNFGDVAGTSTFTGSFVGDGTSLDGVTSYTDSDNTDHLNSLGVISGSEQLPSGLISGSEQVDYDNIQNQPTTITSTQASNITTNTSKVGYTDALVKTKLDAETVISGSSQVDYDSIQNQPTTISGTQASAITTNSSKVGYTDALVKTKLDAETVISGSSQVVLQSGDKTGFTGATSITTLGTVTAGNVTSILPTGVVSGSDQVQALGGVNNNTITFTAGAGLDGGGAFTLNQSSDETVTFTVGDSVISGSIQVDHDATTNFVTNEHIDHSSVSIGSGKGLSGGGNITVSRSLTLDTGSNHFNNGVKTKLDAEGVLSGSSHSGDQTFDDNVTVTGNLTVSGTTTSVNSNTVNIGDNIIVLNSDESGTPSQDGGIEIERGTSTNVRFQFKESTDRWQFSNDGSTYFNLPTSTADITENTNLYYTDARVKTKLDAETVISGSSQVNANTITNFDSNVKAKLDADGVISGSEQISLSGFDTDNLSEGSSNLYYTDARVKTKLNADGVISGSSQVNANTITNFDSNVKTKLDAEGVISGSSQVTITESQISDLDKYNNTDNTSHLNSLGVISGSSQVNANTISNFDTNVDARMDAKTVISGSSQVDYDNIENQPTTISSAQATKLSNITITQAVNLDTLESNVSTNNSKTGYTDSLVKTKLDAEGVISGSSQVNANTITNFDSNVKTKLDAEGVISGSSQVTITESQISDLSHYGDSDVVVVLNDNTVISGSSQISLSGFNTSQLSENTNLYYTDARVKTKLDAEGVISGSSQVNANTITNFDSNVKTKLDAETVISGSGQVDYDNIQNQPTTITGGQASAITTNSGKVGYTDALVKTKLDAEGVISGSSQVSLSASDVGLGNVTNESKATMFSSPAFTGNPTAPTQTSTNDSTRLATTAFVQGRIDDIIGNAGSTLDTLGELSASLASDQSGLASLTTTVGTKLAKSSNLSDLANASTARDNLSLGTTDNVTFGNINGATGTFTGDVVAYSSSDRRLKDNIEVISNPIEKVQQLKGVTWDWNDNASEIQKSLPNVGIIAQDVEKVLPQLVKDRDNGYKGVDYDKIVGLLIESIKDQQKQIDELKSKLS